MWYEALPPMAIIATAMYIPQLASWYLNKAVFGNPFRREFYEPYHFKMWYRDGRIDGAVWKIRGLENIPDE